MTTRPSEWPEPLCREGSIPDHALIVAAKYAISPPWDLWSPSESASPEDELVVFAGTVCGDCEFQQECHSYAMDNYIESGIWGGQLFTTRTHRGRRERDGQPSRASQDEDARSEQPAA